MVVCVIGVSMLVYFLKVSIANLIEINGAIIGFFVIYFLPGLMHAKCLYLPCWSNKNTIELTLEYKEEFPMDRSSSVRTQMI